MSRIEEALEKASTLRSAPIPSIGRGFNRNRHLPPPPPEEVIRIDNPLLVTAYDPHTPAAEEYRKLKSIVVKLTKSDQFKNMLMVTSSIGNEGKTVSAINLAMSLAQEYDHTVMLIDADLRKPSVHQYLGIEKKAGLTECLMDGMEIKDVLIKTGIGRLSVLQAGRVVRNPAEIFSSQKFRNFFLEIKNRYPDRYIIIDTPPVLPFAEPRSLCPIVDGVLLVVKEGAVTLNSITETMECLKGTEMLGVIYNNATQDQLKDCRYFRQVEPQNAPRQTN